MPPILEALAARVRKSARSSFHFTRMRRRHELASTAFSPSLAPYVQSQATSLFHRPISHAQARIMVNCRSDACQQQHDSGMLEVQSAVRNARPMAFLLQPAVTSASAHSNYDQENPQKVTANVSEDGLEGTWSLKMAVSKEIRSMASIHGEVHGGLFSPPFISLAAAKNLRAYQPRLPNSGGFHSGTLPCRHAVPVERREAGVLLPGLPSYCKVVEVGPRDGLQNESMFISAVVKGELINRLALAGLPVVEATSFVSILSVPQLADAREVMMNIAPTERTRFPVLTPNMRGLKDALASGAKEVAVFASATEGFSAANLRCSIEESLERYRQMCALAKELRIPVRGYVSCVVRCPVEGAVASAQVVKVAQALYQMGCYEISLGDTLGVGTPGEVAHMLRAVLDHIPVAALAVHFHDTYGQALANILVALQMGVSVVDSSVGGLGGCPYAKGASGNVATEDVIYMLHGLGVRTGVDLLKVVEAGEYIAQFLGRPSGSKVAIALRKSRDEVSRL